MNWPPVTGARTWAVKMAIREIIVEGNPILRQKARAVRRFGTRLQELVDDMFATLASANGLGLAAPQIAVSERVIVVEIPEDMEDEPDAGVRLALVNPEIIRGRGEEVADEGCLSVPGFYGAVKRATQVTVKAQDVEGRGVRIKAQGLLARVLQHEIDHLDGVLFIDRAEEGSVRYEGKEPLPELTSVA